MKTETIKCFMGKNAARLYAFNMNSDAKSEKYVVLQKMKVCGVVEENNKERFIKEGWIEI